MGRPRTWTDDDLRSAVAAARSLAEVVRSLRLSRGGAAYVTVRTRIERLNLDTSHFSSVVSNAPRRTSRPRRRWTDDELVSAVERADSLNSVFAELGLRVGGSQWQILRARIEHLGLDTGHWRHPLRSSRSTSRVVIAERLLALDLEVLAGDCHSRAELLRRAGVGVSSTAYWALLDAFSRRGIDPSSLDGRSGPRDVVPLGDYLHDRGSRRISTSRLRERLIEEGLRAGCCATCGISRWNDRPAPLQLDHINGDRKDNRLGNLRILCANCHAQTDTWCSRNRGRHVGDIEGSG